MRILHLSSEHPPQQVFGLGRYVCDLAREQVRQGHAVHVLTNSIGGTDQDMADHGVHLHRMDYPPPPKPPGAVAPAMAFNLHLLQRAHVLGRAGLGDPEVVVSHDWLTAVAAERLARRLGVPHVWTVHDTVLGKTGGRIESSDDRITSGIERWASAHADLILVNSAEIGAEIRTYGGDPARMRLLHCGVDADAFTSRQSRTRLDAFRQVFATPDDVLVTFVGRLDLEKGIDTLVNAFAQVQRRGLKAHLAIAGRGMLEATIRKHIDDLGLSATVSLHGYLRGEVLTAFYAVSDIHVCPSNYEPFGLVAVEAMAAGAPVVASDTGGLKEIISHPGVGRLVPPRNASALSEVLAELIADVSMRKKLGAAGAAHVRATFAWKIIAARACELYNEALQAPTSTPMPDAEALGVPS